MAKRSLTYSDTGESKKLKGELSPGTIQSTEDHATVKGVVTSLSPVKKAERVFFGELTDGESIIPLVGFDKSHHQFLQKHMNTGTPVTLKNCQISTNRTTGKLQIVVKSHTKLEESQDKSLTVGDKNTLGSPFITIDSLSTLQDYDRATLNVTAIKVKSSIVVSNGKKKQDVVVADSTGQTTLTLWEQDVGMILEGKSYKLNRIQVHHYLGTTALTYPQFGATAEQIDDLLDHIPKLPDSDDDTVINTLSIIGVTSLNITFTCVNCNHVSQTSPNKSPVTLRCQQNVLLKMTMVNNIHSEPIQKHWLRLQLLLPVQ